MNFQFPWHFAIFVIKFKPSLEDNHSLIWTKRNFLAKPCNTSKFKMDQNGMFPRNGHDLFSTPGLWVHRTWSTAFQRKCPIQRGTCESFKNMHSPKRISSKIWNTQEFAKLQHLNCWWKNHRFAGQSFWSQAPGENVHVLRKEAEYLANKHMLTIVAGETRSQPNGIVLD